MRTATDLLPTETDLLVSGMVSSVMKCQPASRLMVCDCNIKHSDDFSCDKTINMEIQAQSSKQAELFHHSYQSNPNHVIKIS